MCCMLLFSHAAKGPSIAAKLATLLNALDSMIDVYACTSSRWACIFRRILPWYIIVRTVGLKGLT